MPAYKPRRQRKPPARWSLRRARRIRMILQLALLALFFLVVLPIFLIYKPPQALNRYFARRFPGVLFHINTKTRAVALTIDDGPSRYTPEILSVLKENGATATFFIIGGQVTTADDKAILVDIVRQGHELGNHAMHDEPSVLLESDVLATEIAQVDAIINDAYKVAGRERGPLYFRAGSGVFTTRIVDIAAKAGYRTVLGDIYPHDPIISSPMVNAWYISSFMMPGGIIICHDRRSWAPPMLKRLLPEMKRKGYQAVSVSQLATLASR